MRERTSVKDTEKVTFEISGRYYKDNCLPSLNDLLHEATRHPQAYNRLKSDMERVVIASARKQLGGWKPNYRVKLDIVWTEKLKGRKRDYDNIVAAGRKIINDALVKAGYLVDDSPIYLGYGNNIFMYGETPSIRVRICRSDTEGEQVTTDNAKVVYQPTEGTNLRG